MNKSHAEGPSCTASTTSVVAKYWVNAMKMLWGVSQLDQTRQASILLQRSINDVREEEKRIHKELNDIANKVRPLDRARHKTVVASLLRKSMSVRQQLASTTKKRETLEQHLSTLNATQLNQSVVHSVKQTSNALKSMGLENIQEENESVLLDLQESMMDVRNIGQQLSAPLNEVDNEIDLDNELDMLLNYDTESAAFVDLEPPIVSSKIGSRWPSVQKEAKKSAQDAPDASREQTTATATQFTEVSLEAKQESQAANS